MILTIKNDNNIYTGVLEGRLDTVNAAEFGKMMQPLVDNSDKEIILDCSALEYISSSGLRQFLVLRKAVEAKQGKLTIEHINEEIRNIFKITGFLNLFNIK